MSESPLLARLVVLISGNGTNLQALLDACQEGRLAAQVVAVVSNRRDAYGLVRAQQSGVPAVYFPLRPYTESGQPRETYDQDLAARVAAFQPDLIVCAGWMQILTPVFIGRFADRLINLHPALPGFFPGTHAIERAFAAFQQGEIASSGAMVHFVMPEIDAGPVLDQMVVPILPHDQLDDFEERMHTCERILLVRAVQKWLAALADSPSS
jgi:formyltetrahydrofolate-dependent phosphoribosylglycinamide formyltransferase